MLLKRRKGLYGKSHTIWNGWESSVWRFREWHVSCPALLDIRLKLLQNPNLKARLRISFSITKQKNSFFKHFFKLWFSPEVNSDEVYRWKSVSRRSDTWLLCSVVHKRSSCRTQDPHRGRNPRWGLSPTRSSHSKYCGNETCPNFRAFL